MMTRQHYIRIAAALKAANPHLETSDSTNAYRYMKKAWRNTVETVADALADDNPRFDRSRFYAAADYGTTIDAARRPAPEPSTQPGV